jgi:hypothetical protein
MVSGSPYRLPEPSHEQLQKITKELASYSYAVMPRLEDATVMRSLTRDVLEVRVVLRPLLGVRRYGIAELGPVAMRSAINSGMVILLLDAMNEAYCRALDVPLPYPTFRINRRHPRHLKRGSTK